MRIWFVRHGETEWNRTKRYQGHSDIPLNENGRRQAQDTAALLAKEPLSAIYASGGLAVVARENSSNF